MEKTRGITNIPLLKELLDCCSILSHEKHQEFQVPDIDEEIGQILSDLIFYSDRGANEDA